MSEPVSLLMLEFLAWVDRRPRTYDEAMDAWRSTCPRHTVWEDALIDGLIQVSRGGAPQQAEVTLTPRGQAVLGGDPRSTGTSRSPTAKLPTLL
jgi:hypothetical protein